jgi:hypothetical protein
MRSLKSMVGEMIIVRIPALNQDEMSLVKLHGVEANGLWIESQDFTDSGSTTFDGVRREFAITKQMNLDSRMCLF